MKKLFGLLLAGLAVSRLSGAGLIIVGDDKFWEDSPVIIHPTPVMPRHIIVPPRPRLRSRPSKWLTPKPT